MKVRSVARHVATVGEESVKDAMHGAGRVGERVQNGAINVAKGLLRRVRRPWRAMSRRRVQLQERWGFYQTEWGIEREIERLVVRGRPLVAGPWISEVGFETLYWVPFLHWLKTAYRIDPARVIAVSRGGVGSWYEGIADRYIEIWDDIDPVDFARRNAERGVVKQYEPSPFDRDILDRLAGRIGTREYDVLHPGLLYRMMSLYWSGQRPMGFVDAHLRFTPVKPPSLIDPSLLPSEYIAVKFYAARSLPDTPAIRVYLTQLVSALAERLPVVLLDTGLVLEDDHLDYDFAGLPGWSTEARSAMAEARRATAARVISARQWMTPANNLGVQTQIIAGARAFVGTCGSLAWLAPRLGVNTSALFVDPKWLHAHLAVAMRAYHKMQAGRFAVADLRAFEPFGALP